MLYQKGCSGTTGKSNAVGIFLREDFNTRRWTLFVMGCGPETSGSAPSVRGNPCSGGNTMPGEFLSPDQKRRYGYYTEDPSPLQLARYFHFDDRDQQQITRRRTDHTR